MTPRLGVVGLLLVFALSTAACNTRDVNTGTISFKWDPPVENEDGSRLTDLKGYRLYWGPPGRPFENRIDIGSPETTAYVLEDLPNGKWHLGLSAVNQRGLESDLITATAIIKDGETTFDEATKGRIIAKQEVDFVAGQ